MYLGGVNVGYLHNTVSTVDKNGRKVVVNEQVSVMAVALPRNRGAVVSPSDTRMKITIQTEETEAGDVLTFRYQVQNPPLLSTRKVGRVADGRMQIETESGGKTTTATEPWPASLKGPAFADRQLLQNPLKPRETRTVTTFDPRSVQVDTIQFVAGEIENVLMQDGAKKRLLHVVATHSIAPQHVFHEFLDDTGESWMTTVPSQEMVVYNVPKATALKSFTDAEVQ